MRKHVLLILFAVSATALAQTGELGDKSSHKSEIMPTGELAHAMQGDLPENQVYPMATTEIKPEYPGGLQNFYSYLVENVKVSTDDNFKGGKIITSFVIEKDGSMTEVKIVRDYANFGMADEVVRVLKNSPKWTPGQRGGKAVRTLLSLPFHIAMPDPKTADTKRK